jgi:hypothetical protein
MKSTEYGLEPVAVVLHDTDDARQRRGFSCVEIIEEAIR